MEPLAGDQRGLALVSDPQVPRGAAGRRRVDRSAQGAAVGRGRALGGGGALGHLERRVRRGRSAAAVGALHGRQGAEGADREGVTRSARSAKGTEERAYVLG